MEFAFVLFKHLPYGGMQRNMLAIARECVQRGHQVRILCSEWRGERDADVAVDMLPVTGLSRFTGNGGRMRAFRDAVRKRLQHRPADLVLGFNKLPGLDAYYAADSCFAAKAFEARGPLYRRTSRAQTYLAFERAVFAPESATQILEVSPVEREVFRHHHDTPADRFHTLPPGISRNRGMPTNYVATRERQRRELGIDDETAVFMALGSGFRTKGLDRSIRLLADWQRTQTRPAQLLVVGEDKQWRFCRLAKDLGVADQLRFLGGRDDVPALLQAADALLHPAYRENTGNALLEAMIAGRPVVATDVCGYAHYVREAEMGVVLDSPFRPRAFLEAVHYCLAQPDERWRARARAFAARDEIYSRARVAANLLEQFVQSGEIPGRAPWS